MTLAAHFAPLVTGAPPLGPAGALNEKAAAGQSGWHKLFAALQASVMAAPDTAAAAQTSLPSAPFPQAPQALTPATCVTQLSVQVEAPKVSPANGVADSQQNVPSPSAPVQLPRPQASIIEGARPLAGHKNVTPRLSVDEPARKAVHAHDAPQGDAIKAPTGVPLAQTITQPVPPAPAPAPVSESVQPRAIAAQPSLAEPAFTSTVQPHQSQRQAVEIQPESGTQAAPQQPAGRGDLSQSPISLTSPVAAIDTSNAVSHTPSATHQVAPVALESRPAADDSRRAPRSAVVPESATSPAAGNVEVLQSPPTASGHASEIAKPGQAQKASDKLHPTGADMSHDAIRPVTTVAAGPDAALREATATYKTQTVYSSVNQAAPVLAAHETFTALDRATPPQPTSWIHAGTQRAEAGYIDPALGWVSVRAEVHGSSVQASLLPVSSQAAAELGAHLPGLNAHLATNVSTSTTVHVGSPDNAAAHNGGAGQGSAHQDSRPDPAPDSASSRTRDSRVERAVTSPISNSAQPVATTGGSVISVIA